MGSSSVLYCHPSAPSPLLHVPQVRGLPVGTSSAWAPAGHGTAGTSELAEGSGAAAHVYVAAGEGVGEDASSTGMK